ncbi:probable isoaspartyl peptidase/L-asparaginase 3 isoform X4 [Rhodamnia argentea]|uniref:beta-aspartyl-peptidase n=1 Tax=Rhodamnia argentea TaxID=178133 RepID=A0A8B8PDK4_9MYRT|nr:probable isoaspartyl peptidase/L-asparaginase 3 isoform X4 [Rhodamnia argentea]
MPSALWISIPVHCRCSWSTNLGSVRRHSCRLREQPFWVDHVCGNRVGDSGRYPLVVSTWPFVEAVRAAWTAVDHGLSAVDAVVEGCSACEELRCDGTVGPGGSPDENGETTIDALVMDGVMMEVGAVAAMKYVKDGIKAAKLVMQHTQHTLLVGEPASAFAISMGLPGPTNLSSPESINKWTKWKEDLCQPNFRKNVLSVDSCGPYHPKDTANSCAQANPVGTIESSPARVGLHSHDTIAMAVIDKMGFIAVGTSTNGAAFKIPGSYQVVESMRRGMEPKLAAEDAILRIAQKYPDFVGALFAVNKEGEHAGACHGWTFQYSVRSMEMEEVEVFTVRPSTVSMST